MANNNVYSLLIGVGDYTKLQICNLPTFSDDVDLLRGTLCSSLCINGDNIRKMCGENNSGTVLVSDFAKAVLDFKALLGSEDIFICYFSGHGRADNILFSDGQINLQSVIDYINTLPAKSKLIILDSCYSGKFNSAPARVMHFNETIDEFAGHGIAILASSSANEVARLNHDGTHSLFTDALCQAMSKKQLARGGKVSLQSIYEESAWIIDCWNKKNPDKLQQPIFRSNIAGTIFFKTEGHTPYAAQTYYSDKSDYTILEVKPLSTLQEKRLCTFIQLKTKKDLLDLSLITKEIVDEIKYAEIYSGTNSEKRFEGTPASAVWLYFGYDEADMTNHNFAAYTISAVDDCKKKYYRSSKDAIVYNGIYIFENKSYAMIKEMQQPSKSREEFIKDMKALLARVMTMAEAFIVDMQEVANRLVDIRTIQEKYESWIKSVKGLYIRLSDEDIAPNDLHDWSEAIVDIAGWIVDCSILLENRKRTEFSDREMWLINNAIHHYHASVEQIKLIEEELEF